MTRSRGLHSYRGWSSKAEGRRFYVYGILPDEYQDLKALQGGRCGICKQPFASSRDEHLDHDHATGHIRGILCGNCNVRMVAALESSLLTAALEYVSGRRP